MRGNGKVYADFRDGVDYSAAPYSLTERQARESLNFHSTPNGSIKKRYGCPKVTNALNSAST